MAESSLNFPLSGGAKVPSIGQGFDPISGTALASSGLEPKASDLLSTNIQDSHGKYFYVRDSESFSEAFAFSVAASGGGWGASYGMTEDASALLNTNALTQAIHYQGVHISSQSIINQSAQLSTGAAKALAQGIGPFLEKYGTHFVAGYIYGKRCNISYQLEFSSIDLATKFSGSYQESATELGFTETTHANISNALSKSSSHCTFSVTYAFRGFASIAPDSLEGLQTVLKAFQPESALKDQPGTPIIVVIYPWTYLDEVSGTFGLITNDALQDLAHLTNKLLYVKNTCRRFIDVHSYDGQVQLNAIRAVQKIAEQEAGDILDYLGQCNARGTPVTPDRVSQFSPAEELTERMHHVLSSVALFAPVTVPLKTGDVIALQADTGVYLSRWSDNDINAGKGGIDQYSQFKVTVLTDGQVALQADNGQYLSRWGDTGIKAGKNDIDVWCKFDVYSDVRFLDTKIIDLKDDTRVAFRADTGKFLSRMGENFVKAAKDKIDQFSLFKISRLT